MSTEDKSMKMLLEFIEVVELVLHSDATVKMETGMYLLRNSQAHDPEVFNKMFPEFKAQVEKLVWVCNNFETGKVPADELPECEETASFAFGA